MRPVRIGCSGWSYDDWRGAFYPADVPRKRWLETYAAVARETESIVAQTDLDQPVPIPKGVPWFPQDVEAWSVRWVLLHLIEETARHAGHADLIREAIDGASVYMLAVAEP